MSTGVQMVMCPTCRVAVPDKTFHSHSKECQKRAAALAAAQGKK